MIDLQKRCNVYGKKLSRYYTRERQLKNQIDKTQKSLEAHNKKYPHFIENLLKPIAEDLQQFFPNRYYEILGPFGLGCETSIHFYKNKAKKAKDNKEYHAMWDADKNFCKSVTFRPLELKKGELVIVNYKKNTGEFKKGTIGEINGLNHPTLPMPKTIQELRRFVK